VSRVLPGWDLVSLNDLQADVPRAITDGPFGSNLTTAHYTDEGPRVVRLQNIGDGRFVDAHAHISEQHFESLRAHEVLAGDLLVASLGDDPPQACLAPSALGPAIVKADCIRVRLAPSVDSRWVMYALQTPAVRRWASERMYGVGRPRLGLKTIRAIPIPLPPLEEQQRIVEILEDHLSRLDAATSSLSRTRRRLDRFKASALGATWSESDRLGDRLALELVGDVITGATPRDRLSGAGAARIPFVTPGDVGHGEVIGEVARSMSLDSLPPGRVLRKPAVLAVCIGATLGKIGWTDRLVSTNQQINALLIGNNLPAFVAALMAAPEFQSQMRDRASATTMPILNKGQFSKLQVPVPTPDDQQRLLARLELMLESAQRQGEAAAAAEIRTKRLRQSLLAAAFSGRLTERGMDAEVDEELASV